MNPPDRPSGTHRVVLQTIAQVSLLDWLGERVDAVTAVSTTW